VRAVMASLTHSCPNHYPWFNSRGGSICGGGNHFLKHSKIDKALRSMHKPTKYTPEVTNVNSYTPNQRPFVIFDAVHPPEAGFEYPMHAVHRAYIQWLKDEGICAMTRQASIDFGDDPDLASEPCVCCQEKGVKVVDEFKKLHRVQSPLYSQQGYFCVTARAIADDREWEIALKYTAEHGR
jgi:hypothetical protein